MADKKKAVHRAMGEAPESKKKTEKRHVHKMTIERARSGGHIVHHEMRGGAEGESTDGGSHVVPDNDALHDHLEEHMGDQPAAGEGEEPGAEAAAPQAQDPAALTSAGM
jgi:hypothetical protein